MPIHDWTRVPAGIFHDLHLRWIARLMESISDRLPPEYYVLSEQVGGEIAPDVLSLHGTAGSDNSNGASHPSVTPSTPVCTLTTAPPRVRMQVTTEADQGAKKRRRLVIRHVSGDRIVALVEIISPGNKASRNALRDFVENAAGAIDSGINMLIVDLFPPSQRDPQGIHWAIWQEIDETQVYTPPVDKLLTLVAYAAGVVRRAYIEPVAVGDVLTDMPLILDDEAYVNVPLEVTYMETYRRVPRRYREVLEST